MGVPLGVYQAWTCVLNLNLTDVMLPPPRKLPRFRPYTATPTRPRRGLPLVRTPAAYRLLHERQQPGALVPSAHACLPAFDRDRSDPAVLACVVVHENSARSILDMENGRNGLSCCGNRGGYSLTLWTDSRLRTEVLFVLKAAFCSFGREKSSLI